MSDTRETPPKLAGSHSPGIISGYRKVRFKCTSFERTFRLNGLGQHSSLSTQFPANCACSGMIVASGFELPGIETILNCDRPR